MTQPSDHAGTATRIAIAAMHPERMSRYLRDRCAFLRSRRVFTRSRRVCTRSRREGDGGIGVGESTSRSTSTLMSGVRDAEELTVVNGTLGVGKAGSRDRFLKNSCQLPY